MNMNEKLAYLKGIKDATEISSKSTDRVVTAIVDLLDSIVEEVGSIRDASSDTDNEFDAIYDSMDSLEDRLDDIEDQLDNLSDSDFDCYESDEDEDPDTECHGDCSDCICPNCNDHDDEYSYMGDFSVEPGRDVVFTCPNCGEKVFVESKYLEILDSSNSLTITCAECGQEFKIYGDRA